MLAAMRHFAIARPGAGVNVTGIVSVSGKDSTMSLGRFLLPLLSLGLAAVPVAAQDAGHHAILGMPTLAKADPSQREDFLIERSQYVLSYNARTRVPNWVSWRLVKNDIGNAARAAFE